ncbi:MAG TPA: hypothetical protein VM030_07300 [Acidimicrobiales bacterium]|nr:hypothetical protein [Acidimicrobiales bacterium]
MMSPHPDDERLSAWIDGEEPDLGGHQTCAHCQARVDRLRHVARAVAARPAGLGRQEAEVMVRRAVDAAAAPDDVLAFRHPRPGRTAVRRPRAMLGLAAAAAVVVALAAVPLLGGRGEDPDTVASAAPVVDGGDLGDQADARTLANEVRPALGLEPLADSNSLAAPAAPAAGDASAGRTATADGPAADTAAGGSAAQESTGATPTTRRPKRLSRSSTTCLAQAMTQGGPGLGDVVYRATLRWQGTPAEALAFRSAAGAGEPKLTVRLFVMSQTGCRLLVAQSFAA